MILHNRLKKLLVVLVVLSIIGIPVIGLLNNWWGNQDKLEEEMFMLVFVWIVNPVAIIVIGGIVIGFLWGIYRVLLLLISRSGTVESKDPQQQ